MDFVHLFKICFNLVNNIRDYKLVFDGIFMFLDVGNVFNDGARLRSDKPFVYLLYIA